ncbi:MAG: GAF domain-containing sensor histidine kinase [Actinomycetota bacterium]|nr:GAF domain-containing sensor histidine kinase [Actinomycetota bacterium]
MRDDAALWDLLLGPTDLDLGAVAGSMSSSFAADGSLILVVDHAAKALVVGAADPPGGTAEPALRIPLGYGVTGLVAQNGRSVRLDSDSPRNAAHRQLMSLAAGQSVARMCVPARGLSGQVVAVVSVHRGLPHPFAEAELQRAQRLVDVLGLRLHAHQLRQATHGHRSERDRLIAHAISVQEAQRRRVAGDLHDGVTQALVSLSFHLAAAEVSLTGRPEPASSTTEAQLQIASARQLAALAYDETRAAISGLHSLILDDLGLVAALESLTHAVPQLDIEFRAAADERLDEMPDHCAAVLYRVAQEAINNVVKHAETPRVVLSIRRVGDLAVLEATDDGVGFDVRSVLAGSPSSAPAEHFGLSSMAERCALIGATLRIDSVHGRGSAVIVELPLSADR